MRTNIRLKTNPRIFIWYFFQGKHQKYILDSFLRCEREEQITSYLFLVDCFNFLFSVSLTWFLVYFVIVDILLPKDIYAIYLASFLSFQTLNIKSSHGNLQDYRFGWKRKSINQAKMSLKETNISEQQITSLLVNKKLSNFEQRG